MEVVSGPMGKDKTHFTAPPAGRLDAEIAAFLDWFDNSREIDPVLKAGLAYLWFVTIHPFEDGNGRIARAIADTAFARAEETHQRFYSMSSQIRQERTAYHEILERTQKGTLELATGLNGSWRASLVQRRTPMRRSAASLTKRASGRSTEANRSMNDR